MDAKWVSLSVTVLTSLVLSSRACVLNVTTPEVVIGATANVSLECFNPHPTLDVSEVILLRILKYDHAEWNSLAEFRGGVAEVRQRSKDEFLAEGRIGSIAESFLRVTWPVATNDTIGQFRCDFLGFTVQENVMWLKSPPVLIREKRALTVELLGEIVEEKEREALENMHSQKQDLLENITATVEAVEADLGSQLKRQLQVVRRSVEENKREGVQQLHQQRRDIARNTYSTIQALQATWEVKLKEKERESVDRLRDFGHTTTAAIDALRVAMETKMEGQLQVLRREVAETRQFCVKQTQDLMENMTENHKVADVQDQPQVGSCMDVQGVGPRPVVRLSTGMTVVCDTVTDGGGWIVIQRRTSADVDFYRGWEDYKNGFGYLSGNFWFGLEKVHQLTTLGKYELRIDMQFQGNDYHASYDHFSLAGENLNYRIMFSGFSGNVKDEMVVHNGQAFSTKDRDNDLAHGPDSWGRGDCAKGYHGAWWFNACHNAHLNGRWGSARAWTGLNWRSLTGDDSVSFSEIKIRPYSRD
ncbi:fibrinogen C domain-containing protein 1-A [Aplysia californica]|uniref:Fibrinogen C domain-containing protein 1-A n=1 Tax=Aplysia californica TaxID=6500 RepID=A0ABM1A2K2_APLCA|nr:fibrinogen C domain-containing protein 1-A [Aplysia californica]